MLNTLRHDDLSIAAHSFVERSQIVLDRSNFLPSIHFVILSARMARIYSRSREISARKIDRAGFAIADEMTRPSGIEMQSRSRYVWISPKESLAGSSSIYASRFHIGAPWSAGKLGRSHAPCHAGRWHMSAHVFPPAYIAQLAPSLADDRR